MKILCLIYLCFLALTNAGQQPISEIPDYSQSFDEKPQLVVKGTVAVTGSCTIEKNIFYSSFGTFYTTVKLGDCSTKLKAELISTSSYSPFNQCAIKPNCSSSANVDEPYGIVYVNNPFLSYGEVRGPFVSDYINWGCNFPVSGLVYANYNETAIGLPFRRNWLTFRSITQPGVPSFFQSLIDSGIISNPTFCLAVKSSCNFNREDKVAGKLLIGKSIPEVFPKSYARFGSLPFDWVLRVKAASICGEDIFSLNQLVFIDTSTPYIVMEKERYTNFLNKLQSDFGVECLDDGPTNEGEIDVCYLDCAMASKLPRIGLTLGPIGGLAPIVEYFLNNNLVKFGGEDGDGRCSLAMAGHTSINTSNWNLGTSFFNGRTVCFETTSPFDAAVYIGSSGP